jgi:hypothetical protein
MNLTGGCACESIRYECTEEPIVQLICHCRACQRASGSAFAAVMMVAADNFQFLKGEPAYHEGNWRNHWPKNPSLLLRGVRQSGDGTLA